MNKISREFIKVRQHTNRHTGVVSEFKQKFPFTTYSMIFDKEKDSALYKYLRYCFVVGTEYRKESVSQLPHLMLDFDEVNDDELIGLASAANYHGRGKWQHDCVQNYFFNNDKKTLALEVPVFNDDVSGFIDIIRIVDKKIQIADFKPNAAKEKKAPTQLFTYRKLLAAHTGLPPDKFECVWFDDENSYILKS